MGTMVLFGEGTSCLWALPGSWAVGSLSFSGEFVPGICITCGNFSRGSVCVCIKNEAGVWGRCTKDGSGETSSTEARLVCRVHYTRRWWPPRSLSCHLSSSWLHASSQVCWLVFLPARFCFVNLTQARVIWEEGPSGNRALQADLQVSLRCFLDS